MWAADLQLRNFCEKLILEAGLPNRLRDIQAGQGRAFLAWILSSAILYLKMNKFLTLVLESATDSLHDSILDISRWVH